MLKSPHVLIDLWSILLDQILLTLISLMNEFEPKAPFLLCQNKTKKKANYQVRKKITIPFTRSHYHLENCLWMN